MIRSSAELESDDVHIRCRVRRSPYSQNPEFEEAREMTCIMRNWQPHKRRPSFGDVLPVMKSTSHDSAFLRQGGPELLFRAVHDSSTCLHGSERFHHSFSSSGSQLRARQHVWNSETKRHESPMRSMGDFCIPLSDLVVADVHDECPVFLTTQQSGYFECSFDSKNARDMLVTFLTASLPKERIVTNHAKQKSKLTPICSFDVEMLTSHRIQEQVEHETLSEKVRRKVAHVALQIGEMSSAMAECACGGCGTTATTPEAPPERRQSPPRYTPSDMEFAHSMDELYSPSKKSSFIPQLEPEIENTLE